MKTLIFFLFLGTSISTYAQSAGAPPPPAPCGQKGVPDNVPCLKDGKLINTNSPVTVPHTPLTPGGVPNIPAPGDNDSQTVTAPKLTPPKITPRVPAPYKPPAIQPATENTDDAPASADNAPATLPSRA